MKNILLTGLSPTTTEAEIRSWLSGFGSVVHVDLIRQGDTAPPLAFVEMDITDSQAHFIVSRISNYWHEGSLVKAHLLTH